MTAPIFNGSFRHHWTAEILPQRPMILPSRHFVYPNAAEEVERGALEVLVQPTRPAVAQPFLATCALGFRDSAAPTGIWSCPDPAWICAVSGGYAYLIDVAEPSRFMMIRYRPVLDVLIFRRDAVQSANESAGAELRQADSDGLLLFVGHHSVLAWGKDGEAWESDRLSSEGLADVRMEPGADEYLLHGKGWDLRTDRDLPFTLDLRTGRRI